MYIAIAGNIGSGKTTLTEILTKHYGAKAYYEDIDNPYINDFYEDMNRWAFQFQVHFLASRIRQTMDMLADKSAISSRIVQSTRMPTSLRVTSTRWARCRHVTSVHI